MGLFLNSFGNMYILVAVDYIPKWVEVVPWKANDNKVLSSFSKKIFFLRFSIPQAIISDNGLTILQSLDWDFDEKLINKWPSWSN